MARIKDPLEQFQEYDRDYNDMSGQMICVMCEEPIYDLDYIEYDQKFCHCDSECAHNFFDEYMRKDFTYMK